MFRKFALASILVTSVAFPAFAVEATVKAPDAPAAATDKVDNSATATPVATAIVMTEAEAQAWIGKPVYSSDGTKLGSIAAFALAANNTVSEIHADIGGFLGLGETRNKLVPAQFKLGTDRIDLTLTAAEAKALPSMVK